MKVNTGFDPSEKKVIITVNTPLLEKYFPNFQGLIESDKRKGLPKGIKCANGYDPNTALVTFPLPEESENGDNPIPPQFNQANVIAIRMDYMTSITETINYFVASALSKELSSIEFIPLDGYSIDNLKKDIQDAVKGKRDLCLIKDYKEYLDSLNNPDKRVAYLFNQYIIKYGTDEYVDAAINIHAGELDILKEKYQSKLTLKNWI